MSSRWNSIHEKFQSFFGVPADAVIRFNTADNLAIGIPLDNILGQSECTEASALAI